MKALDMELVLEARKALAGRIRRTPTEFSAALADVAKVPVFLKLESLQLTGSFKIRGAFVALLNLSDDERRRGIVTCSAGNHGKAVAYVARELGVPAEIHVPRRRRIKYQGMLALGANVARSAFDGFDETEQLAKAEAARTGRRFVTAFDDNLILAANGGTLAAETIEDCLEARNFLLPVGGAGLAGGFAFYARRRCRIPASSAASTRSRRPSRSRSSEARRCSSCRPSRPRPAASRAASARPASTS